ncbi:uncharacterized protein STEHIDRAFT_166187 [Stereum hirsutum FP-91666 SS1]|uniref:uncharacterized protein n=1 Tax=Stereum hirsutum (strain FP-91666) TaxID=721885 RepID=UPI000440EDFD|nr:uncharacterized protein STEHIDRAFT_166187 [Stereum hirsutum FP-91666 SS1]EIM89884.1 hypothetical protein STEHIDRAFT_166187 [Stereum hirsutum FP-91666 SS1]
MNASQENVATASRPSQPAHADHDRASLLDVPADDKAETSSLIPLPEIPSTDTLDLNFTFSSIIGPPSPATEKVQKRASNVLKLAEENEKLKEELRAMSERLEAAERRRAELDMKRRAQQQRPPGAA